MAPNVGGQQLSFSVNGNIHPVSFLKKLEELFVHADVPDEKKVSLALACLKGSAFDWGQIKEKKLLKYEQFKEEFLNRYWGVAENTAFQEVKDAFVKVVMQYHPNPKKPYFIQCDSSFYGIGGCLFQKDDNGSVKLIAFCSRTLRGAELNYGITEKETLAAIHCLRQWRVFVLGAELTIITDHKSLTFLKKCRLLNSRLTRWTLYMQEYDFNIIYCPGRDNIIADALSRYPVADREEDGLEAVELEINKIAINEYIKSQKTYLKNLKCEQEKDAKLKEVMKQIENKESKWFVKYEGILFKRELDGYKICVPANLVTLLVTNEHENNGHFGPHKVFLAMRRWFYWKHMRSQIIKIVRSCDLCQRSKISKYGRGPMNSVIPEGPNELVCIDLMGPLPKSRGGVVFLLVMIDAFSKYVALYPLKKATAVAVVNRVKKYIAEVGSFVRILSDNATQFRSAKWANEMSALNIQISFTSVYFPQGNSTERVNREIGRLLRSMCHDQHTRWAYVIPEVQKLLNQVVHDSTGFTPEEIHFQQTREFPVPVKFPAEFVLPDRSSIVQLARERLMSKSQKRQERHNKKGKVDEFEVGDRVYLRTHPLSSAEEKKIKKSFLLFEGPYIVVARKAANAYQLSDSQGQEKGVHNVYNLKKAQSRGKC